LIYANIYAQNESVELFIRRKNKTRSLPFIFIYAYIFAITTTS